MDMGICNGEYSVADAANCVEVCCEHEGSFTVLPKGECLAEYYEGDIVNSMACHFVCCTIGEKSSLMPKGQCLSKGGVPGGVTSCSP